MKVLTQPFVSLLPYKAAAMSMLFMYGGYTQAQETSQILSLEQSIQIGIAKTPEMKAALANIGAQQGKLGRINTWPNPSIGMQVDNVFGIEGGGSGYDLTELSFSQPIPLQRMKYEREQANLGIARAEAEYQHQHLRFEYQVAQSFYDLQLKAALLKLAKQRLVQVKKHQQKNQTRKQYDPLIRYLTPLEAMRLDIVLQTTKQAVAVAEGKYHEASTSFNALLGLPLNQTLQLPTLKLATASFSHETLTDNLSQHPILQAGRYAVEEAQAGINVADAQRIADPVVTVFRRTDFLANQRHAVNGIAVSVDVPFWNSSNSAAVEAGYLAEQSQAELAMQQRILQTDLHKSHLHYGHLIEQAKHYQSKVLTPAKKMFALTQRGFSSGELNVLTLIDAYNTYFDAQANYQDLLSAAWQELALLRLNAGVFITEQSNTVAQLEKVQ